MFRGVVLLRDHRAGQPERGPVLRARLHHVLRAAAQGGRAGRHRARTGVHSGHGPGRGRATVAGRQVLLGRRDRRVLVVLVAVHSRPAGRCDGHVLHQRPGPDHPVQPGHVPVLRTGPRLRPRQLDAGDGGPTATGRTLRGTVGRHLRRTRSAGGPCEPGIRTGPAAAVAVHRRPARHARVPHHRVRGGCEHRKRPPDVRKGHRADRRTRGRDTYVLAAAYYILRHGNPPVRRSTLR